MASTYDRSAEDLGNVVGLEHVNVTVPDQQLATLFYNTGLGLTRDPYIMTGLGNMWVNVGRSQFHLPTTQKPQVLRGHTGLVLPDRAALLKRLATVKERLATRSSNSRSTKRTSRRRVHGATASAATRRTSSASAASSSACPTSSSKCLPAWPPG